MILQPVTQLRDSQQQLANLKFNVPLLGIKNGANLTFFTPDLYIMTGYLAIRVYRNGQRLNLGSLADFTVGESGGPGTGFDTVTLIGPAPLATETLTADYVMQS